MKEGERRRNGGNVLLQPDLPSNNTLHYGRALLNLAEIFRLTLTLDVASAGGRLFARGKTRGRPVPLGFLSGNAVPFKVLISQDGVGTQSKAHL